MRAETHFARTFPTASLTASFVLLAGLLAVPAAAQMSQNKAVRGCTSSVLWSPVSQPSSTACYSHCSQNGANACEWKQNGQCWVIFGTGCFLESGYPGWWAALLPGPSSTPVGWLDSADAGNDGRIKGWALDAAVPSTSIDVHVYVDAGTPQVRVYEVPTTVLRSDVNAAYRVSGNHGYDFAIPAVLFDGLAHRVDVYGIDPHGAGNPLLSGSPRYFTHVPAAPTLVSPSGHTYEATPVVTWNATAAATEYQVQVANEANEVVYRSFVAASSACSGSVCTLATGKGLAAGLYQWWVQSRNAEGAGTWSGGREFTVLVPPPPVLGSPRGDLTMTTPTFGWTASAGATRYWLAVRNETGGIEYQGAAETSACAGSACTAAPGKALTAGSYTWNVQAQSPAGVKWGAEASFRLVTPPPPTLVAPNGSAGPTPTFQWTAVAGATSYKLAVDPAEGNAVLNVTVDATSACTGTTCSHAPGTLLHIGSSYTWRMYSMNAVGGGYWSGRLGFTVAGPPTLVWPSGSITTPSPTYTWKPVPGATQYFFALDEMAEGEYARTVQQFLDAATACSGSTCTRSTGTVLGQGQYRWSVTAKSGPGGASSGWMEFSTTTPPPPALVAPSGSAKPKPTFQWTAVSGATSYELAVDTVAGSGVVDATVGASACVNGTCSFAPGTLLSIGSSYTWLVRSINAVGGGPWSARREFTVAGPPSLLEPSGAIATPTPLYEWKPVEEATQYFLALDEMVEGSWVRAAQVLVDATSVCTATACASPTAKTLVPGQYRWSVTAKSGPGGASSGWMGFALGWTGTTRCRGAFLAADFDADGRTDQLCSQEGMTNVALSTGTGFASPTVWLPGLLPPPLLADYNGDGATDLAIYDGETKVFRVALSTGTAFEPFAPWGTATAVWTDGATYSCGNTGTSERGSGNFDGNGYADVYCRGWGNGLIFVGRSTGASFDFRIFADHRCGTGSERIGPADFDGDGRDDWYCIDGDGGLFGWLSNGEAFGGGSFQGPGRGYCEQADWTFVDINADGKTDATCRPNGRVLLSTGTTLLDTGSGGGWCNAWETITESGDPPQTFEVLRSQLQAMDTDGDRIPELVCTFDGQWFRDVTVRKWDGEKLAPPQLLETQWCLTSVQGGDFDGDGKFELVCESGSVLRAGAPYVVPDLMVEARNGIGGETAAAYQPSSVFGCNKPPVRQVVASTTTRDGRGGASTTDYAYCDGRTDPAEGTFLGFGQVRTTLPSLEGESARPDVTTFYSQELRTLGRPTLVRRTDGAGQVLRETETFFHPQSGPALPRQALVREVRTRDFAPSGGATRTTSVAYRYDDAYGNVTQELAHGEVTPAGAEDPDDELRTDLTYWPADTSLYLVSRPRTRQVSEQRGQGFVLLKSVETTYTGSDLTSVRTSVLPGSGSLLRTMRYDTAGNLEYVKSELGAEMTIVPTPDGLHPDSVTSSEGTVTTAWHALCDAPTRVTDPNGTTTTSYDTLCRPRRTDGPGEGAFSERSYEDLGDPASQRLRLEGPGSASGAGNDWSEEYFDGLGRTYRSVRRGPASQGDIVTERTFNARGGVDSETAPFYEGDTPLATRTTYDPFDRVVSVTPPDGNAVTRSYDLWKETSVDPKGKETTVERGTTFLVETTTLGAETVTTRTDFDMLGRRRKLTDTKGNTWTWEYDSLDRLWDQVDPDAGRRQTTYDDTARTQSETDALGRVLTISYDTLGRVTTRATRDGTSTFRYGERHPAHRNWGRLTTVVSPDPEGAPTTLELDYDASGQLVRQRRTIPTSSYAGEVVRDFDAAGRMTLLTYPRPHGPRIGPFGYDEAGRLTSIPGILVDVTYDAAGRPLVQTNFNDTETTRSWNAQRGVLDSLETRRSAGLIQRLDYEYDQHLPLVKGVRRTTAGESWTYGYDDGYRLTFSERVRNTDPADRQTWAYDVLGRITENSRLGRYDYPPDGQPQPHAPIAVAGASYAYDAVGNLEYGGGRAPQWDAENRIRAIGTTRFTYDAFGERLKKVSAQGTSLYPFGDDFEITNGVTTSYVSVEGLGVIAKVVVGGPDPGTFWLHTDRLGSIEAITGALGQPVHTRTYRPYGETLAEGGTHEESRGWIDQRNDGETGLTYLHARYFDPKLGIFLSPDPIGVDGGLNQYAYALGNPVNGTDRSGTSTCFVSAPVGSAGGSTDPNYHSPQAPQVTCVGNGPYQGGTELAMGEARYAQNLALSGHGGVYVYTGADGNPRFTMNPGGATDSMDGDFVSTETGTGVHVEREPIRGPQVAAVVFPGGPAAPQKPGPDAGVWDRALYVLQVIAWSNSVMPGVGAMAVGGAATVRIGLAGEAAVRGVADIGPKTSIQILGRTRIPDGLTMTTLNEVKNVQYLSYTGQLRDFSAYATQNGLRFDLWVRPTTQLSGPLAQQVANGTVFLLIIP